MFAQAICYVFTEKEASFFCQERENPNCSKNSLPIPQKWCMIVLKVVKSGRKCHEVVKKSLNALMAETTRHIRKLVK